MCASVVTAPAWRDRKHYGPGTVDQLTNTLSAGLDAECETRQHR